MILLMLNVTLFALRHCEVGEVSRSNLKTGSEHAPQSQPLRRRFLVHLRQTRNDNAQPVMPNPSLFVTLSETKGLAFGSG